MISTIWRKNRQRNIQNTRRNTHNMQRNMQNTQRNTQNMHRNTQNTQEIRRKLECTKIRNKYANQYAEHELCTQTTKRNTQTKPKKYAEYAK